MMYMFIFFILDMVYAHKGQCASLMCPACDVTAWVREGSSNQGLGRDHIQKPM